MNANELADELKKQLTQTYIEKGFIECAEIMLRQLQEENEELKTMRGNSVLVPSDKLKEMQAEIAELKHMNKNWQISEGMALAEIEELKSLLKKSAEVNRLLAEEIGYE